MRAASVVYVKHLLVVFIFVQQQMTENSSNTVYKPWRLISVP